METDIFGWSGGKILNSNWLASHVINLQMAKRYNNVFNNEISANLNKLYDGPFQRDIRENTAAHFNLMDNCDRVLNNIRYVWGDMRIS